MYIYIITFIIIYIYICICIYKYVFKYIDIFTCVVYIYIYVYIIHIYYIYIYIIYKYILLAINGHLYFATAFFSRYWWGFHQQMLRVPTAPHQWVHFSLSLSLSPTEHEGSILQLNKGWWWVQEYYHCIYNKLLITNEKILEHDILSLYKIKVLARYIQHFPESNMLSVSICILQDIVYVCIHTCMHAYIHIHTYTYIRIHTYVYIRIHTYIQTYIHTYKRTNVHTYIHTYIHIYIHTYVFNVFNVFIQYIYIYLYIYIYIYIHT